jgi:predicted ATP-dependent serine protease
VPQLPRRLAEAARLGFRRALVPTAGQPASLARDAVGLELIPVVSVAETLAVLVEPASDPLEVR